MTTVPLDFDAGPPRRVPSSVLALVIASAIAMAGHLAVSIAARQSSAVWSAWPRAVWVVHLAGILGAIALAGWSLRGLISPRSEPARPIAALGRYAVLAGVIALVCSWTLENSLTASASLQWLLRILRAAATVGIPVVTLYSLGRSPVARSAYGKNVGARVGDHLLANVARDAAIGIGLMLVTLLSVLLLAAVPSMRQFGFEFLYTSEWRPTELPGALLRDADGKVIIEDGEAQRGPPTPPRFGALPVIYGTAVSSGLALLLAVPLSLGAALFLIRVSPDLRPVVVKAGVAGLLVVLLLPAVAMKLSGGTGGLPGVLLGVAAGIGVAEGLFWVTRRAVDGVPAGQPVPAALEALAHLVLLGLVIAFALVYLPVGPSASVAIGAVASAVLWPLAARFSAAVSFLIEFLAAIPSLAYGLWGTQVLSSFLRSDAEPTAIAILNGFGVGVAGVPRGQDMLCAALVLSVMIVPIITAIARDVLRAVPGTQVEGTTALGATWWQSSKEMLKYGRSGLFGAVMLGLARAAGETMAVTMVIGNNAQISGSLLAPAQTMASLLANEFSEAGGLHFSALMYVAFALLVMSLAFNVVARYFVVGKGGRTAAAAH